MRRTDLRRCAISLELSALLLALAGCVTLNIPRTGEMVTRLGDGDIYRGTYWAARGASPDRPTAASPASEAIPAWAMRHAILADLIGPHGRIQCWFGLARPGIGVLGGGRGQCRLPDGSAVASGFPAQLDSEQMPSDAGD